MKIEIASLEDAQELVEIYRYYVEKQRLLLNMRYHLLKNLNKEWFMLWKNIPI